METQFSLGVGRLAEGEEYNESRGEVKKRGSHVRMEKHTHILQMALVQFLVAVPLWGWQCRAMS